MDITGRTEIRLPAERQYASHDVRRCAPKCGREKRAAIEATYRECARREQPEWCRVNSRGRDRDAAHEDERLIAMNAAPERQHEQQST